MYFNNVLSFQIAATNQMYTSHVPLYSTPMAQPMQTYPLSLQPFTNAPRPPFYPGSQLPMAFPGQFIPSSFPAQQPQAPQATYYQPQYAQTMTMPGRQGPPGPAMSTAPQGATQPQQASMTQALGGPHQQLKKKVRDKAIPIINPHTGKNINDEEESLPPSGDSSARETPQPNSNMMVVADFASRVAKAASEGKMDQSEVEPTGVFQQNAQQSPANDGEHLQKLENVVQHSKLQVILTDYIQLLQNSINI